MRKNFVFLFVFALIMACSSDKQAKLKSLKQERDKLDKQISQLQIELAKEGGNSSQKYKQVGLEFIHSSPFNHYVEIQGQLDGEKNICVSSQSSGVINSVLVHEGDIVSKGQLLAQINDDVYRQTLQEAQTSYNFAKDMYEKQKYLWDKKIGSQVQYLTAKNNKEAMENSINTIKSQINLNKIYAPISGTIEEVPIKVGQSISPGFPSFRITNFTSLKVVADVSENYISKIKKGDEVIISFPDINYEMKEKIYFASNYINPTNRTFKIEVRFTPKEKNFKANMITILKINDYNNEKSISIASNLLQEYQDESFVFVAEREEKNYVARKRLVKKGNLYGGRIEIIDGLKDGDKIITSGFDNLEDGDLLSINK